MSRTKSVWLACLLVGSLALVALPSAAQDTADLEKRIEALEKKISTLEKNLYQRLSAIETQVRQGGRAPNPLEGEAQQAYANISRLAAEGKIDEAKAAMTEFNKKYAATDTAKRARRLGDELAVVGKTAPAEWGIEKWYQGESEVDLASGKATLLIFWEVWCPHCQREVPKAQALYDSLKGDGLQVVALTRITKSATEEKVTTFIDENKVGYPCAKENGTISQYFNVSGIPAAAVVKDGKVVWRGHPARLNEGMLKAWL
jgi:thiol-disulfide isomerase/thioredoxin